MALSPDEKDKIRGHGGYPSVSMASTFFLGMPAAMEPFFILEGAMNLLLPSTEGRVRDVLCKCDSLRAQIYDDAGSLVATNVGDITLRDDNYEQILKRYDFFVGELFNALGCFRNPFDKRFVDTKGGGINVGVSG